MTRTPAKYLSSKYCSPKKHVWLYSPPGRDSKYDPICRVLGGYIFQCVSLYESVFNIILSLSICGLIRMIFFEIIFLINAPSVACFCTVLMINGKNCMMSVLLTLNKVQSRYNYPFYIYNVMILMSEYANKIIVRCLYCRVELSVKARTRLHAIGDTWKLSPHRVHPKCSSKMGTIIEIIN